MTGWFTGARGAFGDQTLVGRPRTPDTLKDRGRAELTGTKDSEVASWKGSEAGMVLKELEVVNSIEEL